MQKKTKWALRGERKRGKERKGRKRFV